MTVSSASVPDENQCLDIVGRSAERECLRRTLEALASGRGGAIAVTGEPGLGKSKLLAVAGSQARTAGLPTRTIAPRHQAQPWTRHEHPQTSSSADVSDILDQAKGGEPTVVVADDIHTARPDDLPPLAQLLDMTTTGPLLLVVAYRPRQVPYALGALLTRAADAGTLRTLSLAALDLPEARELVGDHRDLEHLYQLAAGNPLYLQALAEPWGPASTALLGEMSTLSPTELQIAQTAAVLGDHFTAALLAAAAPVDTGQALAALDRLVAADIFRPGEVSPQLAFRHPVLARVVYDQIGVSQRQAMHLRADAVLAESNATAASRARHVARAADPATPGHVETLLQGARENLQNDPASAAQWLATACLLLAESDPRWIEAQLLLARAQLLRGSPAESRRLLHELLPRAEAPHLMSSAAVYLGQADRLLGRPSEARALFEKGLVDDGTFGTGDAVTIHTEIADIAMDSSDFASATYHATVAVDTARSLGDRTGEASALSVAALAQLYAGQSDAAQQSAATAAQLVDGMSDAVLIGNLAVLNQLGMIESALDWLPDAERHLIRGLSLSRRTGQGHIKPDLLKTLADIRLRQGNLAQALDSIAEARAAVAHDIALSALVESIYAEALMWQADDLAVAAAERAIALCEGADETWAIITRLSGADVLIRAGQPDRGSRLLTSAGGGPLLPRLPTTRRARWWESLIVAASSRGDVETAAYLTKHAVADQGTSASAARRGYVLRAQMHTAGLNTDTSLAMQLASSAGECFATAHMRLEIGRTLLDAIRICLDASETAEIDIRLEQARDLAVHCGSQRLLDEAEHLRRRFDRFAAENDAETQLTDRELQVALLARTGLRSKEIAGQLFVSVRTVDTHLSRIYRKLGVSTRTELARTDLGGYGDTPTIPRPRTPHRSSRAVA
ncbi:LuxR C-terminal-related transcriptional regulator [Catellatospora citrea]|uniref:helix-turn-helix transcriptional regulator n=1 Tax=Catellatospora citrea TaxID=53366 RepID=UPI0034013ACA